MEEIDLKQLFYMFWNKKIQIILMALIFIIMGFIYTYKFVKPEYRSYTSLLLAQVESTEKPSYEDGEVSEITQTDITLNQKLVPTYSELIKSKNILREVIQSLNLQENEDSLRNNITVTSIEDTELIEIAVINENPETAKNIANKIAEVFSRKVMDIYNIKNVHIIDVAETATEPYNISHVRDIVIFAIVGIIIAITYVLIYNLFDNTIKTADDVEREINVTVLASIPEIKEDKEVKGGVI